MKKQLLTAFALLVSAVLTASPAGAYSTLQVTGWMAGGGGVSVWSDLGNGTLSGTYGAGAFAWKLDGQVMDTPLYCLDLFHTFHFGNTWTVNPIIVPPDPPNPPPFNTGEAVWVYQKYGKTNNYSQAMGVQLALWEISHDQGWRANFTATGGWWSTGLFKYTGSLSNGGYAQANIILQDAFSNYADGDAGHGTYYQPVPFESQIYGQGQLGELTPVPEPGMLVLMGAGFLAAWVALRRVRSHR